MTFKIIKMDQMGRGICYFDNKITFVDKALVGDEIEISITKQHLKYNEAQIKKIIKPSSKRIIPLCPYFSKCGGCVWQNLTYENSLQFKKDNVIELLYRNKINIKPLVIKNNHPLGYRNKISLKIVDYKIGYFAYQTNDLIAIDECLIASCQINKVIKLLPDFHIKNGLITIRSNNKEEVLIIIETSSKEVINYDFVKKYNNIKGIILNDKTIYGVNYLSEEIAGLKFCYSYDSFFQVNINVANDLFSLVGENILPKAKVLDLYCGVGTLSLKAALKAQSVKGIEIVPNAIKNAIKNAKLNKISNVFFEVSDLSKKTNQENFIFDTLIIDPPRKGFSSKVLDLIREKKPDKIIYVSCDIYTWIRDFKLIENDYEIKKLYMLDMFSYTYRVELLSVLNRKKQIK